MYYLKAIIGARQGNTDLMYNSLRAALAKMLNWLKWQKPTWNLQNHSTMTPLNLS
jgi:hypothetical protein